MGCISTYKSLKKNIKKTETNQIKQINLGDKNETKPVL